MKFFNLTRRHPPPAGARELDHIIPDIDVTDHSHVISNVNSINCCSPTPDRLEVPFSSSSSSIPLRNVLSPSPSTSSLSVSEDSSRSGRYDFVAKIILLGDYGVGKSTLLRTLGSLKGVSWCHCKAFRANELVELECGKNDKKVLIRIMDTGGQERFRSMTSSYFCGAHGCLLTFSVTNEESFDNVIHWFHDLNKYACPYDNQQTLTSLVLGTVPSSSSAISPLTTPNQRSVSVERAFRLAESLHLTYCETHVRDEQMILFILRRLVNEVIIMRERRPSLTITIAPSSSSGQEKEKRWKCCRTS